VVWEPIRWKGKLKRNLNEESSKLADMFGIKVPKLPIQAMTILTNSIQEGVSTLETLLYCGAGNNSVWRISHGFGL
jgi:hypothetical protein